MWAATQDRATTVGSDDRSADRIAREPKAWTRGALAPLARGDDEVLDQARGPAVSRVAIARREAGARP